MLSGCGSYGTQVTVAKRAIPNIGRVTTIFEAKESHIEYWPHLFYSQIVQVSLLSLFLLTPVDCRQWRNCSRVRPLTYPISYDCSITIEHVLFYCIITDNFDTR